MKISSLEEYALRCLMDVARLGGDEPVAASDVAEVEGISLPYAQKVLRILTDAGLVESKRGVNGGYLLSRPIESISVGDVMRAVGGMFETEEMCERHDDEGGCAHAGSCTIKPVWNHIADFVVRTLDSVSVALLLKDGDSVSRHLSRVAPVPPEMICPVASGDQYTPGEVRVEQ